MKKGIMLITIVTALAFLVSVMALAPSFAAETTKTTIKQQPKKQETLTDSSAVTKPHKQKFWDLEVDRCLIKNVNICEPHYNVFGTVLNVKCFYNVKTPPINDITQDDAAFWGKGRSFTVGASMTNNTTKKSLSTEAVVMTPQFTWRDVLAWKKSGKTNAPKVWKLMLPLSWKAPREDFKLLNSLSFVVDKNKDIEEYIERNNMCQGTIEISPVSIGGF